MLEIIVSKKNESKEIALVENGKLVEIYDEYENDNKNVTVILKNYKIITKYSRRICRRYRI